MFINVQFGYQQSRLFNLNCQVAPLLDSINNACYQDMQKFIKKREEFFNKEVAAFKKKEAGLVKQLEKLNEKPEEKETVKPQVHRKMSKEEKKKFEEEQKKLAEEKARKEKEAEEARIKAAEEEALRKKEEEEAKAKAAKGGKKPAKGQAEEVPVEKPVETEEEKKEREKAEIQKQIDELRVHIEAYSAKAALCIKNIQKVAQESDAPKVVELTERDGARKHLHQSGEDLASNLLRDRKAYVLTRVVKNEQEEEVVENIVVDGACIRTPDEDIVWAERQKELEAEALKGNKGKAPPKKK